MTKHQCLNIAKALGVKAMDTSNAPTKDTIEQLVNLAAAKAIREVAMVFAVHAERMP